MADQPDRADPLRRLLTEIQRDRGRGAAYILETRDPQATADVARAARDRFGALCEVEPLFPTAAPAPGTFFLARLPGLRFADLPRSPYDWAYAARDRDGFFRSVEPDLTFPVQPPPDPSGFESSGGCFLGTDLAAGLPPDWALQRVGAYAAWELAPPAGGAARGAGIRVGHLDTGRAEHRALPAVAFDPVGEYNFFEETADPTDPLDLTWSSDLYPEHPGHGTATGSVIAGRGAAGTVLGAAPAARLVSLRCIRSVVVSTTASTVARAIVHAADSGCHVISMSLGGLPRRALQRAVEYAVSRDVIVLAAAGNCVRYVVAPALYDSCIAVAGINNALRPWSGSCSGAAVDVSAPGEFVTVATRTPDDATTDGSHLTATRPGQGTSFATALTAGAAACWLAFHGRVNLLARYVGRAPLQSVFGRLLRETAHAPDGWDAGNYGAGVLDIRALLAAPLPAADGFEAAAAANDYASLLARLTGSDPVARSAGFESAGAEPVGAELIDTLYTASAPATGFESARTDPIRERIRAHGSARLRRAASRW